MKKLIILTHSAASGGAERVSCILANQFVNNGYEVTLYAVHADKREYYLDEKIHYIHCDIKCKSKLGKMLERASKIKKFVNENKFDVLISFVYLEGVMLVGNSNLKKIYSLRNDPSHVFNTGLNKIIRNKIFADADKVVFQTPDARDFFKGKIREHGVVISNPIRDNLPMWDSENHNNDIVTACRITEQKNLKMMIDAFKIFNDKNPNYRLVIYGKGDLLEECQEYARKNSLENKVIFPGFSNDIDGILAKAAMFVSSSDYEGISNSLLEALAIGTPAVCTDCPIGGARLHINNGKSGFLVNVGDYKAMADKMLQITENKELQLSFSRESQKLRNTLTETNIFNQWNRIISNEEQERL